MGYSLHKWGLLVLVPRYKALYALSVYNKAKFSAPAKKVRFYFKLIPSREEEKTQVRWGPGLQANHKMDKNKFQLFQ